MNDINFSTPNGFPLEADATLGFMQSDYRRAIEAMAIFVSEGKNVILSGVNYYQSAGQTYYSEGWVVTQYGQLMRFVGGVAQTTCCLEETIVQKPNADGTLVSRYYTRRMVFGAGALQVNFSDFKRIEGNNSLTNALHRYLRTRRSMGLMVTCRFLSLAFWLSKPEYVN